MGWWICRKKIKALLAPFGSWQISKERVGMQSNTRGVKAALHKALD